MAKTTGFIGYVTQADDGFGVITPEALEQKIKGDLSRVNPRWSSGTTVAGEVTMSMSFSFLANKFAIDNLDNIRYFVFLGKAWKVNTVQLKYPRVQIELGGAYNGQRPKT